MIQLIFAVFLSLTLGVNAETNTNHRVLEKIERFKQGATEGEKAIYEMFEIALKDVSLSIEKKIEETKRLIRLIRSHLVNRYEELKADRDSIVSEEAGSETHKTLVALYHKKVTWVKDMERAIEKAKEILVDLEKKAN